MFSLGTIFSAAAPVAGIYGVMCFVRVLLTWFPGAEYSPLGRLLGRLCDPYLNLFRGLRFLRVGMMDFSPMLALGALAVVSSVLGSMEFGQRISLGGALASVLLMVWGIIASVIVMLVLLLLIRLVALLTGSGGSQFWEGIDRSLSPLLFRITGVLTGGRSVPYRTALIAGIIVLVAVRIAGGYAVAFIARLFAFLPV